MNDWRKLLEDERSEIAALTDSFTNGDFDVPVEPITFSKGETVRITAPDFKGQYGEVACIEEDTLTGTMIGVWLDKLDNIGMFRAEELEKVA